MDFTGYMCVLYIFRLMIVRIKINVVNILDGEFHDTGNVVYGGFIPKLNCCV